MVRKVNLQTFNDFGENGSYAAAYTYDAENQVTDMLSYGVNTNITYDALGRISAVTIKKGDETISEYDYEYMTGEVSGYNSATGYLTQKTNSAPYVEYNSDGYIRKIVNSYSERTFMYTSSGRLASEIDTGILSYSYNANNDILQVRSGTGSRTVVNEEYTYNKWGQLSSYRNVNGNKVYGFSYDAMGNPTKYKNSTLNWKRGRLLSSGTQKGNEFTYSCDDAGSRYEKVVNGTRTQYYYTGGQLLAEKRGSQAMIYYFYSIDGVAGMVYNNNYYFYEKNPLGDIIKIKNGNGNTVATYDYDAWGNIVYKSGAMADINPFRYRGYYYDNETGFYYLQTRYYDPEIRRFINADNYELIPALIKRMQSGQRNKKTAVFRLFF